MKFNLRRGILCAVLALFLLTGASAALFSSGKKNVAQTSEEMPIPQNQTLNTYKDVALYGQLTAVEKDSEVCSFQLSRKPTKGTMELQEDGSFVYLPKEGKTGNDRFQFTVTDTKGNTSAAAEVSITVQRRKSGVSYRDMAGNPAHAAAQTLAEKGIFVGTKVGEGYYFQPDAPVSRGEFLAMAMTMAGMQTLENVMMTGFYDDESIPVWAKSYVSTALKNGIVLGIDTGEGVIFNSDGNITSMEAATVLNRILQVSDVDLCAVFGEESGVPDWAAQAVANMTSVSVMAADDFSEFELRQTVSRAEAAQMLAAAMEVLDSQKQKKSFLDWLL